MTTTPLHEITAGLTQLQHEIEESGGEITPEIESALTLLEGKLPVKVEGICKVIRHFEADEMVLKDEMNRLAARRAVASNAINRLKDYLKRNMEALGEKKIATPLFVASICKNSQVSVSIDEGAEVPDAFAKVVTTVSLDREKVLEVWKSDPAAIPLAINVVQGDHLRIR